MPGRGVRALAWSITAAFLLGSLMFTGGCRTDDSGDGPPSQASGLIVVPTDERATVTLGDVDFEAEVARDPTDRAIGLSGRSGLRPGAGMLFVFDSGRASTIWMKGMLFPLDIVWIGVDCRIVDVTLNAPPPAPATPDSQLPTYASTAPAAPAAYVFEVAAGEAKERDIKIGDTVRFSAVSDEAARC